jgi:alpha-D-ribose 1-methylphosphonate 5-triphosphate synthase subunit PhnG
LGLVRGSAPDLAADLAVIDAACAAGLPEAEAWGAELEAASAALEAKRAAERSRIDATRVDFRSMDQAAPE